jgi:hypothetical protein
MVKTGRNEAKRPISPCSEFGVFSRSEDDDGLRKESKDEADAECLYCSGLFSEDHDGK